MKLNPETLARASSRHPGRTIGLWFLILVAAMASLSTLLAPALTTSFDFTNNPEAKQAKLILEQQNLISDDINETFVVAGSQPNAATEQVFVDRVNALIDGLKALGPTVMPTTASGTMGILQ